MGPDAEDFLQRWSQRRPAGEGCDALLLTAKARIVAPLRVLRRGEDDFLLLPSPALGEAVRCERCCAHASRRKCEIEPEEHTSTIVLGTASFAHAEELIDARRGR